MELLNGVNPIKYIESIDSITGHLYFIYIYQIKFLCF